MVSALEIAEGSIALLEKAAQEADALEAQARQLQVDNARLVAQNELLGKQASARIDRRLLLKVASVLEQQDMLVDGMTADKLASLYEADPNRLADITLRLLCPVTEEGQSIGKQAFSQSPNGPKTVRFNGQDVVDHDGWLSALG